MRIIRDLTKFDQKQALSLTIGNFDGVHLGHQKILDEVKKKAHQNGLKSGVLTFANHPIGFFKPELAKNFLIFNLAQKLKFFKQNSLDFVFILPFNENFCKIDASEFIENILKKQLNVKEITVGHDFTFGKNRQGDFSFLQQNFGKNATKIDAIKDNQTIYSSSEVRKLLKNGQIKQANQILGKNFEVQGFVNNGKKIAHEIGFKTANIKSLPHLIQPEFGVYKTLTHIPSLGKKLPSITNFGTKPTFGEKNIPIFETHIFDFSQNLYGKKIIIEFVDFIRKERKFDSIEELKAQIEKDVKACKN